MPNAAPAARLRLVATIGGFYRAYVTGEDENQDTKYTPTLHEPYQPHALIEIARGATKAEVLASVQRWFAAMEDGCQ